MNNGDSTLPSRRAGESPAGKSWRSPSCFEPMLKRKDRKERKERKEEEEEEEEKEEDEEEEEEDEDEDEEEGGGEGVRVKGPLWRLPHSPTQVGSSGGRGVERKAPALAFGEQPSFPTPNPASFPGGAYPRPQ